jgi:hypothetical protein
MATTSGVAVVSYHGYSSTAFLADGTVERAGLLLVSVCLGVEPVRVLCVF